MEVNIPSVTTSWTAPVFKACTGMNTQYLQNLWNVYGIHKYHSYGIHMVFIKPPALLEAFSEVP